MTTLKQLVDRGHPPDEAAVVLRLIETAHADREAVLRTGLCACGGRMSRVGQGCIQCVCCDAVHAA